MADQNPYDKILQADNAQAARASMQQAAELNPDTEAKLQGLARQYGVPVEAVRLEQPAMERRAKIDAIDYDGMARGLPATSQTLADPKRAAIAHDDIENMGQIERKLRQFGGGATEAVGMAISGTGHLLDIAQRNLLGGLANLVLPTPRASGLPTTSSIVGDLVGADWRAAGGEVKGYARNSLMIPAAQQTFGDQVAAGLGQVAGQIAMLPIARGSGLYTQGADTMAEKLVGDKLTNGQRDVGILLGAGITGATEKWALDALLGPLAVPIKNHIAASLARIGIGAAAEGVQEFSENTLQDVVRSVLTGKNQIDIGQSLDEGGVGAAVGGIVRSIVEAGLHVRMRGHRAEMAEGQAAQIEALNQMVTASKVLQRDPETFESFIREATQDGPVPAVFIDAQALLQSGVADQVAAASPSVAQQLEAAAATGGQIAIPVDEYASKIAATDAAPALLDHLKTDPEGFSRAEAQAYMQEQGGELQAEIQRVLEEQQAADTFKAQADVVRAKMLEQLNAAGRFTPQANESYASLVGNFYAVQAARLGITPGELYQRFPLTVSAQQVGGQQLEQGPRGAFSPGNWSIALLKDADLSTFLHEMGHASLEMQTQLSSQLAAIQDRTAGENELIADSEALMRWFGLRDLAEWQSLDFEERRAYHEKFARGFEAYLFEGKAPSIELHGLFQRFRAWLLNIYRDIKRLNVELSDEVRGVMDRMLATNEQIQLAEQGRSMMPLFRTAEQAGMTPEEFAAYQALGIQATADAIEDLQARGMRDLQWIQNAKSREMKRLQKEADVQRAQIRMEVRREVMSQPVYRAWQFLTGKINEADKLPEPERFKSDPDIVDPGIDSLFVAIAKLGGINRESAASLWGVKPEDKPQSGLFGKPVLRAEGKGLTVDQMAEKLAELGYLAPDENGNTALRDFEESFQSELSGSPVYSSQADYDLLKANEVRPGDQVANIGALAAGRLDVAGLADIAPPPEVIAAVKARRMTSPNGIHPDIVADLFGFTSGDELVRTLAAANPPKEEIDALTDQRMLERFGDLSSPEAIERAADAAIHNAARGRMLATEANALAKATGQRKILADAARQFAAAMVARLKVRDVRPGQYASAEAKAARAAQKASQAGDIEQAAAEKRNELVNHYATRAAYDAQDDVAAGLRYLNKFDGAAVRKGLSADYTDQIDALLDRFDLRKGQSLKAIDKRKSLAEWYAAQQEAGMEPDIPPELLDAAYRTSYKDMTVEEFRGLVDTVKQIEHLGRLKQHLLTTRERRAYEAVRDEMVASINEHAGDRQADTRTPTTNMGRAVQGLKRFWASHIKAATWARVMDGGKDGGPVWEYLIRSANERGDMETTRRAEATAALSRIMAPVFAQKGRMGGSGQSFPSIGRSLNREARIAIALNWGNEGNRQRLLGGEGWTQAQVMPVLQSLTPTEWAAVQQVWDHFESYRPDIAAKERRIYGKEPVWVDPAPFTIKTEAGEEIALRGGYYPIKYDPAASQRAEEFAGAEDAKRQMQGAFTSATTRRSFTKARTEEVTGRPLLYTLAGLYSGVNDVIHDLSWHEWLIDANRLLRSRSIDSAIREHYGPEVKAQFKSWVQDIAEGDKGSDAEVDIALSRLRQGVSAAGLGFNVVSAAMQPLGITQSIVRVGPTWVARGIAKYIAGPIDLTRQVNEMSSFMQNRARTRFRELNELRNQVQDQSAFRELTGHYAYLLMMRFQQMVDVPTWWGAYEKGIAEGNTEERARDLADQAVIDAQGGGQTKDLSAIERGGPTQKLFTVFYSFMNTALNIGAAQTMAANTPAKRAKLAADYLLLYVVPAALGMALKNAVTPGDSGDDDPEKLAKKLLAAQIDYLMGLMVVVREFSDVAKTLTGANDMGRDYTGPAGLRVITDAGKLAKQASQGEFDDAFRKSAINLIGSMFGLPAAQINRSITGAEALAEGKTDNPAALAFGFQEPR